jgi:predicted alpha/beta hydrolase
VTPLTLQAADGSPLAARLYEPPGSAKAGVLIAGAMGVRQDYYAPFARWLSAQGFRVASFDYRGVGDSRPAGRSLRDLSADLFDWAADTDTVIVALRSRSPTLPIVLVGHSLGAQLPGLLEQRGQLVGLLSVAAGSGYWRDNAPRLKRIVPYFWYVLVPLATALCGYFPGRRIGKVGDLPRGVILQWRRWCLNPEYHVGAEGEGLRGRFAALRFPVVALSITDDELMTERGTRTLVDFYAGAPRRVERIAPSDAQARRIGHFGFFRPQFEGTLWARSLAWLHAFIPATERPA